MISAGVFLWHAALSAMVMVVWRLSVRLGRAMRDDVGAIAFLPVSSGLLFAAGVAACVSPLLHAAQWVSVGMDVLGSLLGWYAAWHSWGWLVAELRQKSSTGVG
jgi:hypothetical protein